MRLIKSCLLYTSIAEGYGGTVSQHADVQAYLTLRVLRNALDGVDVDTGIGTADEAGNVLSKDVYKYSEEERSYYALNAAVCLLYTSRCV